MAQSILPAPTDGLIGHLWAARPQGPSEPHPPQDQRVSATETKALLAQALERLGDELPALARLKLVMRVELRARGADAPIWRVEVPGPKIDRDPAGDARLDVSVARSHFNELAQEGTLRQWADAYDHGHVKVTGDPAVVKLLGNVVERQLARSRG